jgi:hypothetical protein
LQREGLSDGSSVRRLEGQLRTARAIIELMIRRYGDQTIEWRELAETTGAIAFGVTPDRITIRAKAGVEVTAGDKKGIDQALEAVWLAHEKADST